MIHYDCDFCKRVLDAEDLRYIVRMEVYAALDNTEADDSDNDRDHLQEIEDILEQLDATGEAPPGDEVYQQLRFDLCAECRKKFLSDPLGRRTAQQLNFSQN
jgi:hypothetical protein